MAWLIFLSAPALLIVALKLRKDRSGLSINATVVETERGAFLAVPIKMEVTESAAELDFTALGDLLEDLDVGITLIVNKWPGRSFLSWRQEGSLFMSGLMWKRLGELSEAQSMLKAAISAVNSFLGGIRVEIDEGSTPDPDLISEIIEMGYRSEEPAIKVSGKRQGSGIPVIEVGERRGKPFSLSLSELSRHVLIIGQTGSGKTTTAKRIIQEAWNLGIPSLILDIHWEYKGLVFQLGGRIFSIQEGMPPACINPLSDLHEREAPFLISETLSSILDLTPSQFYLLNTALRRLRDLSMGSSAPTIRDLVEEIRSIEPSSHAEEESKASLLRKMEPIVSSPGARIFECDSLGGRTLEETISLVDMGDVESDILRQIATFFILKRIKGRFAREEMKSTFPRLVVVIEEAEKLIPAYKDPTGMEIVDRLFSELRKFGISLVLVSQNISEIPQGIVRNSGVKMIHRVDSPSDIREMRSILGDRSLLDRISRLPVGSCLVTVPDRVAEVRIIPPREESLDAKSIEEVMSKEEFYFPV